MAKRSRWRTEVKQRLYREFDFEDPNDWAEDGRMPLEIAKLGVCDLVLANMWKESIGTTVGIVRASQQGKPVVLMDPNRLDNAILNRFVEPEKPVHTWDEAYARLRELAASFKTFEVEKSDRSRQLFQLGSAAFLIPADDLLDQPEGVTLGMDGREFGPRTGVAPVLAAYGDVEPHTRDVQSALRPRPHAQRAAEAPVAGR